MATYTFYDTEGTIALSNIDNELIALWGSMPAVKWLDLEQIEVSTLQDNTMLEVTLSKLANFDSVEITHLIRNFTDAELQKRVSVISIRRTTESIAFRIAQEGNKAKFVFRIHKHTISMISENFSSGIKISLGVDAGKISLIIKKKMPDIVTPAPGGVALNRSPSGGVKIPR